MNFWELSGNTRRYRTFDLLWRTEAVQRETGDLSVASSRKTVYRKRRVENCFNSRPYCGRGVSNVASDTDVIKYGDSVFTAEQMSTLTIPSTASLAVTVAAYDARTFSYADFSGRGPAGMYEGENVLKPDIAAPGVRVTAPVPGGGYQSFSGTSFAAPFVTGSAALLMEWGIVRGNDPYLYGEKVKAYLRKGAKQLAGYERWPNALLGYGEDVIIRLH